MKSLVFHILLQLTQKDDIKTRFVAFVLHLIWKVLCMLMIIWKHVVIVFEEGLLFLSLKEVLACEFLKPV